MFAVLDATVPQLPADRPRYLMGVGTPDDLLGAVQRGIDMFDCVMPTRAGRTARAYTSQRRAQPAQRAVRRRSAARSTRPAPARPARGTARAYLHHLFRAEEMLGPMLLTWHNLTYYQDLMRGLRGAIADRPARPRMRDRLRAGWTARRTRHDRPSTPA